MCGGGGKQKTTKGEKAQAKVAKQQWADYEKRYIPIENKFIEQARSLQDEDKLAVSRAVADSAQAYDPVRKRREAQMMGKGVNPNAGKFTGEMQDLGLSKAATTAKTGNEGRLASESRFLKGLMTAVKNGRGIADQANYGFQAAAKAQASAAHTEAAREQAQWDDNMDLAGTVAGAATSKYGEKAGKGLKNAWDVGYTFATQAGQGTWGDPFAGPRERP